MALPSITTRTGKGSALTFSEADANFENLRDAVIQVTDGATTSDISLNSALTFTSGSGISITNTGGTITIDSTVTDTTNFNISDGTNSGTISDSQTINFTDDGDIGVTYNSGTQTLSFSFNNASGYLQNVSADISPNLGGPLDGVGNTVSDIVLREYAETVYDLGTTSGTLSLDCANGNVQKITVNGDITVNGLSNALTGQSLTLIITQDATGGRNLTSSMKFSNSGDNTLSGTTGAIDILTIFYDGTNYFASLGKDYQ